MKKTIALLLAVLMILSIVACAANTPAKTEEPATTQTETTTPDTTETEEPAATEEPATEEHEPVTLEVFLAQVDWADAWDELEARFEEQHPWISIEHVGLGADADFLQQRLAANDLPDAIQLNNGVMMNAMVEQNLLTDLTNWECAKVMPKAYADAYTFDGKLVGMCQGAAFSTMFYNMDILNEAGWDTVPTCWDELIQCCKDIKEKTGVAPLVTAAGKHTTCWMIYELILANVAGEELGNYEDDFKNGTFDFTKYPEATARLQEIAMQPDAPFLGAGMGTGDVIGIIPTLDATVFVAMTEDGKLARGFETLYTEMEKVRRYGFTQGEFERAQENLMRQAERSYANRNDRRNNEFVQTYLNNYQKNQPMPDAETEWQLDSMLIKMLNVDAVNAFAKQTILPTNQVIVINAPEKEGVATPTAEEILAIRDKVAASEVTAYEDNVVKEPLIAEGTVLKGSPVKKTVEDKQLGTTEWTLANGAKVVVKPTTFKADEVRLGVVGKGGLSLLSDEEYYMGEMMPAVNSMSGVGKFSATELKKQLSGKTASVQPSVENYTSAMGGVCSPKDIETMLQLLYLNFTQPRFNKDDVDNLTKMLLAQLANAKSNPDFLMQEKVADVTYGHNPRRQMISTEIVNKFDFEQLPGIYAKLYPGANGFVFTFVGNIDPETLKPLVEKYIGSIPAARKPINYVDDKAYPVKGEVTEEFTAPMQQPKVSVNYHFSGEMPYTLKNKMALTFLTQALNSRYLVSIREEKGGTYGVRVQGSTKYIPRETYSMTISFDTNEEMADELREIVMKEIEEIAANGPKSEDIEKNREFMLKSWKNSLEQNGAWMSYIQIKYGSGLNYIADHEQAIRDLTNADVQALAKKILADGNLVKVVMRPSK